uniref:Uncharacterized protein n=1 Tax=Timema shepardi TaxID=629360 RepID=A0A7R9AZJ1_TIMSH|nr:unnamed protein product [Timema shepardi]
MGRREGMLDFHFEGAVNEEGTKSLTEELGYTTKLSSNATTKVSAQSEAEDAKLPTTRNSGIRSHLCHTPFRWCNRNSEGHPFGGFFKFRQPCIVLRDPELIKNVIVKDFINFQYNDFQVAIHADPLFGKNPFCLKGEA